MPPDCPSVLILWIWKVRSEFPEKEAIFPIYSNEISYLCFSTVDYHLQKWITSLTHAIMVGKRMKVTLKVRVRPWLAWKHWSWLTWEHWTCLHEYWHGKEIFLATDILQIQCHKLLFLLVPSYKSFLKKLHFSYFLRSGSSGWVATDGLQVLWPVDLSCLTQLQI